MYIFFDYSSIFDSRIVEKYKDLPQKRVTSALFFFSSSMCFLSYLRFFQLM